MEKRIVDIDQLASVASFIISEFSSQRVFALKGEMGAGKTTFSKLFCKELGVDDEVNSPTFAIANIYDSNKVGEVYHFDFYRLKDAIEAIDIGFEDYIYSGNYCLLEWPDIIIDYIPKPYVEIHISYTDNKNSRLIEAVLIE